MSRLGPRGEGALALLLLALALWAFWALALVPGLRAADAAREEIARLHRTAAAAERRAGTLGAATEDAERLDALLAGSYRLLPAAEPSLAGARLQSDLGELIEAAGGRVTRSEILAPEDEGGLVRLTVRAAFEADSAALGRVLAAIEHDAPDLTLGAVTARALRQGGAERLTAQVTVAGLLPEGPEE